MNVSYNIESMSTTTSIGIRKWAQGQEITQAWARGVGDGRTIGWEREDGERAIETNGDPAFPWEVGFEESWAAGVELCHDGEAVHPITGADAVALAERDNMTLWRMEREYHSELTLDEARWALANRPDVVVAVLRRDDGSYVGPDDES